MKNWIAGIIAIAGLLFFFFVERNLVGFIVLIICALVVAVLFSESELQERIKRQKLQREERRRKNK